MDTLPVFQDLFLVWLVGLLGGLVAYALKQPLLLGYMLGGILVSPFTPGPTIQHVATIQHLADFGVVLLMFSIGLELAPVGLRRIGRTAMLVGVGKTLLVVGLALAIGASAGWSMTERFVIGAAMSISSTMVITKMLMERGEMKSDYGQLLIGIAIIEDCLAMGFLMLFPLLADPAGWGAASVGWVLVKAAALLVLVFVVGGRVVPRLLAVVQRSRDPDLSVLVLLSIAMGVGVVSVWAGLSLALGAFLGGLVVSGSDGSSQALWRMLPIRDLFVVTFFVSLGILLDVRLVAGHWPQLLLLLVIVLVFKLALATLICLAARCEWHVAWRVGIGLSQIGEFSIVLSTIAQGLGLIAPVHYHMILAVSLLSILINTFFFNLLERAPSMLSRLRARISY